METNATPLVVLVAAAAAAERSAEPDLLSPFLLVDSPKKPARLVFERL